MLTRTTFPFTPAIRAILVLVAVGVRVNSDTEDANFAEAGELVVYQYTVMIVTLSYMLLLSKRRGCTVEGAKGGQSGYRTGRALNLIRLRKRA